MQYYPYVLATNFIDFVDGWLHLSIARASSALRSVRAAIGFPFGRRTMFLHSSFFTLHLKHSSLFIYKRYSAHRANCGSSLDVSHIGTLSPSLLLSGLSVSVMALRMSHLVHIPAPPLPKCFTSTCSMQWFIWRGQGTGHCPADSNAFLHFEIMFLPIPVSRCNCLTPACLLSSAARITSLSCPMTKYYNAENKIPQVT